jgi:hypothetical protein
LVGSAATASAQPRLPARFEQPALGPIGLDVVNEQLAPGLTPAAPARKAPAVPGGWPSSERHRAQLAAPLDRLPADAPPPENVATATEQAPAVTTRVPAPRATTAQQPASAPVLAADAAPRRKPPAPVQATPAAITRRVAAVPAAQARPPLLRERHEPDGAHPAADAPAVRVHIGRLEVRANLQPAAPAAPQAPDLEPRRQELALSAYLRGEREAR